ncbi:MAG: hypothetical protein LBV52_05210, partial [Spirochaetaceae bacterium]|nr:hypothetical protein [Spirochaetaceae bacterium]
MSFKIKFFKPSTKRMCQTGNINSLLRYMRRFVLLLCAVFFMCVSCRPSMDITQPDKASIGSWSDLFTAYWSGMDHYYLYWDIDKTDWNAVWDTYKPKFDALSNDLSFANEAFEYFSYMSGILSDGHYSFVLNVNGKPHGFFSPADVRVDARADANAIQLLSYKNDWSNKVKGNLTNYHFFNGTIKKYLQGGTTLSGSHNTNRVKLK